MTDRANFDLMVYLRFLVARFAMWFCGCPVLFWTAPKEWEEYMSIGEPYTGADDDDYGRDTDEEGEARTDYA